VIETSFLKSLPYFARLDSDQLASVRNLMFEKKALRGDTIVIEGEPADALYFVHSGAVKTFRTSIDGKEQVLNIVRPGESFNDVAVFDNGPNLASARAMGPVEVFGILKRDVPEVLKNYPQIALSGVYILSAQMRYFVALIDDLSFRPVMARVAKVLINYMGDGAAPAQHITQQDMAAIAGTARELVGRSLRALERSGLIKFDRHRIRIIDKEALKSLAGVSL
jgi:CRP/FNR family transcriptional regulator